jgi:CDK inhibitor PHO81
LVISAKPDVGIPYNIILPLKDDSELYTFVVDDLSDFSLIFDIYPTFGTKVLGRSVILPSQLAPLYNTKVWGPGENESFSTPLFDTHLRVVGELSFNVAVVTPFNHSHMQIGGKVETYWKSTTVSNFETMIRRMLT